MFKPLKSFLAKKYISFRSWKTNRRIIVLESDDWGSERSIDAKTVQHLIKINPEIGKDRMSMLDTIASQDDLSSLFEVLHSVKDIHNRSAVLTINVCTANPDFERIKQSNYNDFFYIPFYQSIKKRIDGDRILSLWQNGISDGLFFPQLHGREHLHALAWLNELRLGNRDLLKAFDLGVWGIPYKAIGNQRRKNLQAALDSYGLEGEFEFQLNWIKEGNQIFKDYFGYQSLTFIPPAYIWPRSFLDAFRDCGIQGIQGTTLQTVPLPGSKQKYKWVPHINGLKENGNVFRLARNAYFEPYTDPDQDWVDTCLKGVNNAFSNKQPAIIGTHRVNFIGVMDENFRDKNLSNFQYLIKTIKKRWPDVEFLNSAELLSQIKL
jgi:hypothetical protein